MNVSDNDFFTLCRLVSDAEDWYESGQMDAVGSYLKDMQRILNNQKSSVAPELWKSSNHSIHDLNW